MKNRNILASLMYIAVLLLPTYNFSPQQGTYLTVKNERADNIYEEAIPLIISGKVSSGVSPITGASIILDNILTATTDSNGRYVIKVANLSDAFGLPVGNHVLAVIAPGYRTKVIRQTNHSLNNRLDINALTNESSAIVDFSMQKIGNNVAIPASDKNFIDANDKTAGVVVDEDQDGIDDIVEDWFAQRFAPIVYHGEHETNYPAKVDWFLLKTSLHEFDDAPSPDFDKIVANQLDNQSSLLGRCFPGDCQNAQSIRSDSTRSRCKQLTYYLADLSSGDQPGEQNAPQDWITYVHSYGNQRGGITIQYWRFYAQDYANKYKFKVDVKIGPVKIQKEITPGHGGDWEGIAVHLNSELKPEDVAFLGHTDIEHKSTGVQWKDEHPKVWSEEGGHSSNPDPAKLTSMRFIEQQTWIGGKVIWWDGTDKGVSGGLLNVGEKSKPLNDQVFVQYSGIWGSPGMFFVTSGYWGPAFNETGALCEDEQRRAYEAGHVDCASGPSNCGRIFHTAWCDNMSSMLLDKKTECYAGSQSR